MKKGKLVLAVLFITSFALAGLDVFAQKETTEKRYVGRTYEPGNFSKNFGRIDENKDVELIYAIEPVYKQKVVRSRLQNAITVQDIVTPYPKEITTLENTIGIVRVDGTSSKSLTSKGAELSEAQKELLKTAQLEDKIEVRVSFETENAITRELQTKGLYIPLNVGPEVDAKYSGDMNTLLNTLEAMVLAKTKKDERNAVEFGYIEFVINTEGQVEQIETTISTENERLDETVIQFIKNMPQWEPALNSEGTPLNQKFEISIGSNQGC